jgi:DNA polymerase III delta subunit
MAPTCICRFKSPSHTAHVESTFHSLETELRMVFVITGSDFALARRRLKALLEEYDADGLNTVHLDALVASVEFIASTISTGSIFGSSRVVVIHNLAERLGVESARANHSFSKSKRIGFDLKAVLTSAPSTTIAIVFEPSISEPGSLLKAILPGNSKINSHDAPRGDDLVNLALELAQELGYHLERVCARELLDTLFPAYWQKPATIRAFDRPPSVELLTSEIQKLGVFAHPQPIAREHVEELASRSDDRHTYALLDAIVSGRMARAVVELRSTLKAGEDGAKISAQAFQQIELAVASRAEGRPSDPTDAGHALALPNPKRLGRIYQAVSRSQVAPSVLLKRALHADRNVKFGLVGKPEEALIDFTAEIQN